LALDRPTLKALIERVKNDFEAELAGSDAHLRRSIEYVLARVLGGLAHGMYGYLYGYILRQIFPDTADEDHFWRWAAIWGVMRKAAVYWKGTYRFTGVDTTEIDAGTELQRSDGLTYTTDAIAYISGAYVDVAITATSPGADWNCDDGQTLALVSPIPGIDGDGIVQETTQTGTDLETKNDGLVRLLLQISEPPSGGGPGDYERWALEVAGVTRAWEFPRQSGPGTVSIAFVRDGETPIVPDLAERNAVLDYIELYRPVTAEVNIIELTEVAQPITLTTLTPNTAAVRAAVTAVLEDLFSRESTPLGTITLSRINETISLAAGEEDHVMSVPAANVTATISQIVILGAITFP